MPSMKFAISAPNVGDAAALVDLAVATEAAGWDAFFLWDHVQLIPGAPVHDPWLLLGAAARSTERVRLGTMVTPIPRRRPWNVAKQLVTLDHLSAGRAVLGVGIGAPDDTEFADFGEELDRRRRGELLDEGLAIVDRVCRGEPYRDGGPTLPPGPVQRPRPPIWVAGMAPNRPPLRRAARWDGFVPIAGDGEPLTPQRLADYCGDLLGRDGFDVVATRDEEHGAAEYEAIGCTWIIESAWPVQDWMVELRERIDAGPGAAAR
jgi:alkanesulfonate monooxygenase SsuD/methylene tetrahydromethanopterin reductase-like flavin-dependent oxidoreductase (luciferase family)